MNRNNLITGLVIAIVAILAIFAYVRKAPVVEHQTLTGTISYREKIALLPGSIIEVSLNDVSKADAPAEVLASSTIVTVGENVPVPFALQYDPSVIQASSSYALSARILVDGSLRWVNTSNVAVLTNGAPTSTVDVMVSAVASSSSGSKSIDLNGATFRLKSYNGTEIAADQKYTVTFGAASLNAKFCNSLSGGYSVMGNMLKANMMSTLMYCGAPADLMIMESAFGKLLNVGAEVSLTGATLTLKKGQEIFVFDLVSRVY